MTGQTLRDWVARSNEAGIDGPRDRYRSGRPCGLAEGQQAAFKALILKGLDPARDGLSAWRIRDPCARAAARFGRRSSATGMLRRVKSLNLSWQQARPINRGPHSG